jgi:hypothetical protein
MCKPEINKNDKWGKYVIPTVNKFVAEKSTSFPSMSNRAVFKFMDMLENL